MDMEQRSEEWFKARLGKATGSRIWDIVAKTGKRWGSSRSSYAAQLIAQRLSGVVAPEYLSPSMVWGIETEGQARLAYGYWRDVDVKEVGFIDHPRILMSGASPDGLVGDDGLVEIKCPNTTTHIDMLLGCPVPTRYITQMQWQMAVTGRSWCDFVSFDPRMPVPMTLFVMRVERDDARICELETMVCEFLEEVDEKIEILEMRKAI